MARYARNPSHPLTRLRRQLSTPDHQVTREELAQRTKIPVGSLKSIESGKYAITTQIAAKISLGVPVNPFDLLRPTERPLHDHTGQPLSADSVMLEKLAIPFLSQSKRFETDQYIERIALAVAEKKFMAMQLRFLMREAFAEILESLGLSQPVAEELTKDLYEHPGEFDPAQVPMQLRPHRGESAKRWETFETLVRMEEDRLWMQKQDQEPTDRITEEMSKEEKQRLNWESVSFEEAIRAEALANVAASMKKDAAPPLEKSPPVSGAKKRRPAG